MKDFLSECSGDILVVSLSRTIFGLCMYRVATRGIGIESSVLFVGLLYISTVNKEKNQTDQRASLRVDTREAQQINYTNPRERLSVLVACLVHFLLVPKNIYYTQWLPLHPMASITPNGFHDTQWLPWNPMASMTPNGFHYLPLHPMASVTPNGFHDTQWLPWHPMASITRNGFHYTQWLPWHPMASMTPNGFHYLPLHPVASITFHDTQWLPLHAMASITPNGFHYTQWLPLHPMASLVTSSVYGSALSKLQTEMHPSPSQL